MEDKLIQALVNIGGCGVLGALIVLQTRQLITSLFTLHSTTSKQTEDRMASIVESQTEALKENAAAMASLREVILAVGRNNK